MHRKKTRLESRVFNLISQAEKPKRPCSSVVKLQIKQQKKAERHQHKIFAQNFPCMLLNHLCNGKAVIAENTSYVFCCFYEELCFSDTKCPWANAKLKSE